MKTRVLAALVVACLAALVTAGCGNDSEGGSGGNSTKELASTPGSGDSGSDSGSDVGSGSSDGSDATTPDTTDPEDATNGSIPGFGDLGDCINQAAAYASLAMSTLGGEGSAESAEQALEQMKASLPEDLRDDIQVVADGYQKVAKDGFVKGGKALDTPEFRKADEAITAYFEDTCGGG